MLLTIFWLVQKKKVLQVASDVLHHTITQNDHLVIRTKQCNSLRIINSNLLVSTNSKTYNTNGKR